MSSHSVLPLLQAVAALRHRARIRLYFVASLDGDHVDFVIAVIRERLASGIMPALRLRLRLHNKLCFFLRRHDLFPGVWCGEQYRTAVLHLGGLCRVVGVPRLERATSLFLRVCGGRKGVVLEVCFSKAALLFLRWRRLCQVEHPYLGTRDERLAVAGQEVQPIWFGFAA